MTRSKFIASVCGLFLVGGALLFFRDPPARPMLDTSTAAQINSAVSPSAANAFRAGPPMKRVMDLYESESRRVGSVDPDPKATQGRLEIAARDLKTEEILWLEQQAFDAKTDPDAKFFAVYLMGLSHSQAGIDSLGRIALSPVPPSKNERKMEEGQALRASATEGISQSCKDFPETATDKLLEVLDGQTNEFVRDRAHRGLYTCQTGKPIADQDKEALRGAR